MSAPSTFTLLPMLPVVAQADGKLMLTRKFVDGLLEYAACWDGRLRVLMEPVDQPTDNLDNEAFDPRELPFDVVVTRFDSAALPELLAGASVVLGGLCHQQLRLAGIGRSLGIPIVYTSEYSLRTRHQWALAEERNPLRLAYRLLWESRLERGYRKAVSAASGLQANGTPTFAAYAGLCAYPILFFDSRLRREMILSEAALEGRLAQLSPGRGLRIAYSGRLNRAKGVIELLKVARELARQEVRFELSIFGAGPEEESLRRHIQAWQLGRFVRLEGVRDFRRELVGKLQREFDLFLCCHKQGDPACTYLETFGCGLPIVGYANEALAGLLGLVNAGRTVGMGRHQELAGLIRELSWRPELISGWSRAARRFAAQHTFEESFRRRMDHIQMIADMGRMEQSHGGISASA